MRVTALCLALSACGPDRGNKPVNGTYGDGIDVSDQALPIGFVGQPYDAPILVGGGTEPYTFEIPDWGELPGGLALDPSGHLVGVPSQAGDLTFPVLITDAAGREKTPLVTATIVLEPTVVRCGETLSGTFAGGGFRGDEPDFDALDSIAWLAVELPIDEVVTRVDLQWDLEEALTAFVEKPSELVGSWDVEELYVAKYLNPLYTDLDFHIDAGTNPGLSGYAYQRQIPILAVPDDGGDWSVTVVCSDGPVFERLTPYPVPVGTELLVDFDVFDDNDDVRIFPRDPAELPPWVTWDESTGVASGTALTEGGWEFTIVAESGTGARREELAILGAYEVIESDCGGSVPIEPVEGYYDGEFTGYYDPKGYKVVRMPVVEPTSSISLALSNGDQHFLGTAWPDPGPLNFYPGGERTVVGYVPAELTIDEQTYPSILHYLDDTELYVIAGTAGLDTTMDLDLGCGDGPRPAYYGLPVFQPLTEDGWNLDAIGGIPPYSWSSRGLPDGITLSEGGRIAGSSAIPQTTEVDVTIRDKDGRSRTTTYDFYVSEEEACAGAEIMDCGETITGTFTQNYVAGPGPASTVQLCLVHDLNTNLAFSVESVDALLMVDVVDPGATFDDFYIDQRGTYVAYVDRHQIEAVAMNPWSYPPLSDYRGLPIRLVVRAYDPGDWRITLTCE